MTFTCVSAGSGNASIVSVRNENHPHAATTSVKKITAARFWSEKRTMRSSTACASVGQLELVQEEDGALRDVAGAGLEPAAQLHLALTAAAHRHRRALELPCLARGEYHRLLAVADDRVGRHTHPALRLVGREPHLDEGIRAQDTVGVLHAHAYLDGPPL